LSSLLKMHGPKNKTKYVSMNLSEILPQEVKENINDVCFL